MKRSIEIEKVITGTLSKVHGKGGDFYHLTWKEKGKTVTRYIRLDEVNIIKNGIKAYKKARSLLDKAARLNLKTLFHKRKTI